MPSRFACAQAKILHRVHSESRAMALARGACSFCGFSRRRIGISCFALDPPGLFARLRSVNEQPAPPQQIVLFDGVCNLCSAWTRFLIRRDPAGKFKLCSIQSQTGRDILAWAGVDPDNVDTMVYVRNGRALLRSSAFLGVMQDLGLPWSALGSLRIVPRRIRDFFYSRIAENRYRLFGQTQCMIPSPEHKSRFIDAE
jgi:predicted DCC family thiol-disulfide oxidoreductase YuxK